jgi:hypothetical protein
LARDVNHRDYLTLFHVGDAKSALCADDGSSVDVLVWTLCSCVDLGGAFETGIDWRAGTCQICRAECRRGVNPSRKPHQPLRVTLNIGHEITDRQQCPCDDAHSYVRRPGIVVDEASNSAITRYM